jgi:hypothetical protein
MGYSVDQLVQNGLQIYCLFEFCSWEAAGRENEWCKLKMRGIFSK